jgi:hypothetical protein
MPKRRKMTETVKKTGMKVLATDTAQGVVGAAVDKMDCRKTTARRLSDHLHPDGRPNLVRNRPGTIRVLVNGRKGTIFTTSR